MMIKMHDQNFVDYYLKNNIVEYLIQLDHLVKMIEKLLVEYLYYLVIHLLMIHNQYLYVFYYMIFLHDAI